MDKQREKIKVLLIEDNKLFRLLFREALERLGHEALEAEDGQAGLETAKAVLPDLILLDLMIPKLHGFDVLKAIREDPATRSIRVVVLSVLNDPQDIKKSFEYGADDYIVKGPSSPEEIVKQSCRLVSAF